MEKKKYLNENSRKTLRRKMKRNLNNEVDFINYNFINQFSLLF